MTRTPDQPNNNAGRLEMALESARAGRRRIHRDLLEAAKAALAVIERLATVYEDDPELVALTRRLREAIAHAEHTEGIR